MAHYFGTDGFRGEANVTLTARHAFRIGRFLGWYFRDPAGGGRVRVVIGKDTRRSSYLFEYALAAGLTASGADAYILHVITTPGVSYVTRTENFDCGVMISASHNIFSDNGIKLVNRNGEKMDDETIRLLEAYLDGDLHALSVTGDDLPFPTGGDLGCVVDYAAGRNRYIGYLISLAAHSYKSLRIGLDCANGSAWMIARSVFEALGARVYAIGDHPDGTNINREVGSTHMEGLQKLVRKEGLDVGFAFDGDADRCLAVDENGDIVTGDHILYIFAKSLRARGMLTGNTVVTTVMSNLGLYRALEEAGIGYTKTTVGDRFVWECMTENGYEVGGEQSGHIILKKYATTGDGILTAIQLTEELLERKESMSRLASPVMICPQVLKNLRVVNKKAVMNDPEIRARLEEMNRQLGGDGRVLLRESGTEPVIRVMAEAETTEICEGLVDDMIRLICSHGLDKEGTV